MKERDLYHPIVRGALVEGWAVARLEDGTPGLKPGDIFGVAPDGKAVLIEVKVINHMLDLRKPIPWNHFRTHQQQWLCMYAMRGGYAFTVFYIDENPRERKLAVVRVPKTMPQLHYVHELPHGELTWNAEHQIYLGWKQFLDTP